MPPLSKAEQVGQLSLSVLLPRFIVRTINTCTIVDWEWSDRRDLNSQQPAWKAGTLAN